MIAFYLALKIASRNQEAVEEIISLIAASYSEVDAIKTIFKPVLELFSAEDREWFDQMRENAKWNS